MAEGGTVDPVNPETLQIVDIAAIRAALAAATPGSWWSGTDLDTGPNHFWDGACVYALDASPWEIPLSDPSDGETTCNEMFEWCDVHERGSVAETHNYISIPDAQHDANNHLIGNAPTWLAALCLMTETYKEQWLAAAAVLRDHATKFEDQAKKAPSSDHWTVPSEHRPSCPLDGRPCTSWTCLVDVCDRPRDPDKRGDG